MRQQEGNKTDKRRTAQFVDGNTAKDMQSAPQRRGEEVHRELERKKKRDKEEQERRQKLDKEQRERKRKQERALQMSPGYLLFVAAALVVMAGVTVCYLQMRAELTRNTKRVASLESEVLTLKSNNDSKQQKLEASIDLEAIRKKAMEELGMVYPSQGQIEYFEMKDSDYMNQYKEIPSK